MDEHFGPLLSERDKYMWQLRTDASVLVLPMREGGGAPGLPRTGGVSGAMLSMYRWGTLPFTGWTGVRF